MTTMYIHHCMLTTTYRHHCPYPWPKAAHADHKVAAASSCRTGTTNASRSKRPCHHQRELFAPERTAVRPGPLRHHNVRTRIA